MFSQLTLKEDRKSITVIALSDRPTKSGAGKRLCLVSDSSAKIMPTADGAARWLAKEGWDVTLLDLTVYQSPDHEPHRLKGNEENRPYRYIQLKGKFRERHWYEPMQALCAYQWLKAEKYDLIIFQHGFGAGYFCGMAKELGLAFASTPLVAMADDPYAFWLEKSEYMPTLTSFRTDAEIDFLERVTVAKVDAVLLTDKRVPDWMQAAGWVPEKAQGNVALLGAGEGMPVGQWLADLNKRPAAKANRNMPLISVCIATLGKDRCLNELLVSLRDQSVSAFEVVLINGASGSSEMESLRKEFLSLFEERGWAWIESTDRNENSLRNLAAGKAGGDYILFLNEEDVALPDMIELIGRCAQSGAVEIMTVVQGRQANSDSALATLAQFPARTHKENEFLILTWIYYGASLAVNSFINVVGNGNIFIKKETFAALGGFEDTFFSSWKFLLRAATKNHRIHVAPEILVFNRREDNWRYVWNERKFAGGMDVLAAIATELPGEMRSILLPSRAYLNREKQIARFPDARQSQAYADYVPARLFSTNSSMDAIKVVLCADDNFLIQACVTIASIFSSAKNPVDLFLIAAMTLENQRYVEKVAAHFGHKINVLPANQSHSALLPAGLMWGKGSTATYWRVWLFEYLPGLDKVIYLDCDIIVRDDLMDLWSVELGDNLVAASRDPFANDVKTLPPDFGGDYFNAGILVINLEQWRKQEIARKVLEFVKEFEAQNYPYQFYDQSPINKAVNGQWVVLSPTWNYHVDADRHPYYLHLDEKDRQHLRENAAIYHFRTGQKPWNPDFPKDSIYAHEYRVYQKLVEALLRTEGYGDQAD